MPPFKTKTITGLLGGVETPEKDVRDETDKHDLLKTNKSTKQQQQKEKKFCLLRHCNTEM